MVPYILDAYLHRWNWLQRRRCFNIRARIRREDLKFGTSNKKSPMSDLSPATDNIPVGKLSVGKILKLNVCAVPVGHGEEHSRSCRWRALRWTQAGDWASPDCHQGPLVDQERAISNQSPSYCRADELYGVVSDSLGDGYPDLPLLLKLKHGYYQKFL